MPQRPPPRVLLGVGLVAGCTLALQVLLTRLFSAVLFYHFGFLAISLALLGTGAGGLALYVRPRWFERAPLEATLARGTAALAVLLVVVPAVLVRLDYTYSTKVTTSFAIALGLACLLSALPFLAAGVVIALAIRDYTRWAGRVYAADLVGAGIGAIAVVPVLWLTDPATLIVALGAIAGIAALLFAGGARRERRLGVGAVALACVLAIVSLTSSLYFLKPWTQVKPFAERWTPLSRVIGYPPKPGGDYALLFYDRVYAPVPVRPAGTAYPTADFLHLVPQSLGYALSGRGRALVIGGGGGRDIYNALSAGVKQVDVIELNRGIVDVVDRKLGRWSGSPYTLPHVHTRLGDGRSILASGDARYDQIHIGFTDTLSANSATAFALTENNLYTIEALEEYYDHLRPDGVLNISRLHHLVGDEALRATVLTLQALQRRGVVHPERNVVTILSRDVLGELFGTTLSRIRPWSPAELARIRAFVARRHLQIAYAPGGPYRLEWAGLARARSPKAFCTHYRLNVCGPTDDKPFFFNMNRLSHFGEHAPSGYIYAIDPFVVLVLVLGILLVLCVVAFVLPLGLMRKQPRPPLGSLSFFAAIGVGFLLLEIALIQRFVLFLGFPTYALSVVLFSLLVFTGVGALLSGHFEQQARRALLVALSVVVVLIVVGAFALPSVLRNLIDLPFAGRVAMTVLLLAPLSIGMGMAMPIGLRRLGSLHPTGVPWAWSINGVTSVLASAAAVAIAITAGFTVTTLAAAACYALALAHAAFGRWPRADPEIAGSGPTGAHGAGAAAERAGPERRPVTRVAN